MKNAQEEEIEAFKMQFRTYGLVTAQDLLSALLIWLFGNLVFIPLANSVNWQTAALCSLIFFASFTILVLRAFPGLRNLIHAFSVFPARKWFLKRGLSYEDSLVVSRQLLYMVLVVALYLLYLPFLVNFHPSIGGIVLIVVLIYVFFLALKIMLVSSERMLDWLFR